jgi:predicted transcriptional regulator
LVPGATELLVALQVEATLFLTLQVVVQVRDVLLLPAAVQAELVKLARVRRGDLVAVVGSVRAGLLLALVYLGKVTLAE